MFLEMNTGEYSFYPELIHAPTRVESIIGYKVRFGKSVAGDISN
jgi:hypothetical protein